MITTNKYGGQMKIGVVKSEIYVWVQRGWWVATPLNKIRA